MTINLKKPDITELKPRITVFGVGGGPDGHPACASPTRHSRLAPVHP